MKKGQKSILAYALNRLLQGIPMIIMVIILTFVLINLAPGDPVSMMTAGIDPTPDMRALLEKQWGIDEPLFVQLIKYLGRILTGDFGMSYFQGKSVVDIILERLPPTLLLMMTAILISTIFGIVCGIISAYHMYKRIDSVLSIAALIGYSAPLFWVGQVLIIVFAVVLDIFPVSGMHDLRMAATGFKKILDTAKHLFLPSLSLTFWFSALMMRVTRTKMSDILQSDYIKTARAKGLSETKVIMGHAFRNALAPIITVLGFELGAVVMGATVVETIFGWPGMGRLMYESILRRDYPLITGIFFFVSLSIILVNILVDIMYAVFDPQVRYE